MSQNRPIRGLLLQIAELKQRIQELESEHNTEEEYYVASSRRCKFHRPSCDWASYFMGSSSLMEFFSHVEAVEAGYKPCGTCKA